MNILLCLVMSFITLFNSTVVEINKDVDFLLWKENTLSLCEEECKILDDDFYLKECNYWKQDIELINTSKLDSLYKLALKKAKVDDNAELKYYIHYFLSGEVNEVFNVFVFKSKCGRYLTVRSGGSEEEAKVRKHKRISKEVLRPKSDIINNDGFLDDLGIVTEFDNLKIKSNTIVFKPELKFFDSLMEL